MARLAMIIPYHYTEVLSIASEYLSIANIDVHRRKSFVPHLFLLRAGRVSVAIRGFVYYGWYGPAGEVQLDRDQRFARDRHSTDGVFLCLWVSARYPGRIDSNKQCFHHHFMSTCLLRATISLICLATVINVPAPRHTL
jgi:hypothetical protein